MLHPHRPRYVDAWQDARVVVALFEIAARTVSVTVEVFLRRRFGERYLSPGLLVAGGLAILPVASLLGRVDLAALPRESPGTLLFLAAYCGFAFGRRLEVARRLSGAGALHSWSDGASYATWERLGVGRELVRAGVEPVLVLVAGAAAALLGDPAFGTYLAAAGVLLFLKEQRMRARLREAWLDEVDRRIEEEELAAVLLDLRGPDETRGFAIPGVALLPRSLREELHARATARRDADDGAVRSRAAPRAGGALEAAGTSGSPPREGGAHGGGNGSNGSAWGPGRDRGDRGDAWPPPVGWGEAFRAFRSRSRRSPDPSRTSTGA